MFFFIHGRSIMIGELKNRLQETASLTAAQFDPATVDQVKVPSDMKKEAYKRLVTRLRNTRHSITNIRFAYILRQTADPLTMTFVADADGLSDAATLDTNHNGVVDEDEMPSYTGDTYDITHVPALQGITGPTVDASFTSDQWGTFMSGYAPIRRADGSIAAVVGVDMDASDFTIISQRIFSPVALLLIGIAGIMMAAYVIIVVRQRRLESMRLLEAERTALMDLATHQLGAPLATFRWWIEILQEHQKKHHHSPKDKKEDDDAFEQLHEGITRMDDIVESLRTAVHMQSAQVNYRASRVSIRTLLNALPKTTRLMIRRRKQKLVLKVPASLRVSVDRKLFTGVLQELIENASWYSPDKATITVTAKTAHHKISIEVIDRGYGISPEDLPHIFEQFKRGSVASHYKPVGNGLGLYIAKGIVQGAKGTLSVDSIVKKGTTFTITLPAA